MSLLDKVFGPRPPPGKKRIVFYLLLSLLIASFILYFAGVDGDPGIAAWSSFIFFMYYGWLWHKHVEEPEAKRH